MSKSPITEEGLMVRMEEAELVLSECLGLALVAKGSSHPTTRSLQHAYTLLLDAKHFAPRGG